MDRERIKTLLDTAAEADEEQRNTMADEIYNDFTAVESRNSELEASNIELADRLEDTRKKYVSAVLGAKTPATEVSPTEEKPERTTYDSLFK